MTVFHLSAECYPAAKVGGLADVAGALPKYLQKRGVDAAVVLPKYKTEWICSQKFVLIYEGMLQMDGTAIPFTIEKNESPGFPLFLVNIPPYFDQPGIYGAGHAVEAERFIGFQIAALTWICSLPEKPDIIHCHDHHTALVPFMMSRCKKFEPLALIPTIVTVHNAEYQGRYSHKKEVLLPDFDAENEGLLDWNGQLNSLAAGLKCCWKITTVSPSYMQELQNESSGLELLFAHEKQKSQGILNGIDETVWNPETDDFLTHHYAAASVTEGKRANKNELCKQFGFEPDRPLIAFIGRLVPEKGADLLPDLFASILKKTTDVSFLVLGTGWPELQNRFQEMKDAYVGFFDASVNYNERLAHRIYAGSDFLIMPSRVEPCGLNQLYAMRYGTIPVARKTGGLKDTVRDITKENGCGITFQPFTLEAAAAAVNCALTLFHRSSQFSMLRKKIMKLDFSWNVSAQSYIDMYKQIASKR